MAEHIVVFWTEAGHGIGMGHLCRSLVIARECIKLGMTTLFVINDDPFTKARLLSQGFLFELGEMDGAIPHSITTKPHKTIIFDTKKDIEPLIGNLKKLGHRVVLLDNTSPARLVADVVIYPVAQFVNDLNWDGFAGRVYGGAKYVPVAEEYVKIRQQSTCLKHEPPYRVVVSMGGSDPQQLTYPVVKALLDLPYICQTKVVIGPAFMPDDRLIKLEQSEHEALKIIRGQNDLSFIMADCHVAITAVGITLYELAAVGVPAIIIGNYVEDRRDMELYQKLGMNLPIGYHEDITATQIQETVSCLLQDAVIWQHLREIGWQTIDGWGAQRIAGLLATRD